MMMSADVREKFHKLARGLAEEESLRRQTDWEPVITIGQAASLVGLSPSALRKYEREGLILCRRTAGGRRLYCRADIDRVRTIKYLINDLGLNVEGIRRLLALLPCWDLRTCAAPRKRDCTALQDTTKPCWMIRQKEDAATRPDCQACDVYRFGAFCAVTMKRLVHRADRAQRKHEEKRHWEV
jgi:MerR family transcriptional regulator/heat shock protein HspR